ncbi:MAG TPA: hypothetical protein ENK06_00015, partial [Gammaproteobacteria bacterium]|nr:hypothetical protein [Gammaproteobacteria bacterium]
MARKRKKSSKSSVKNKKNHLSTHKLAPQALEQKVKALLAAAKFREAVDAGKKLLKLESSPDRQVLLAAAYEGRARGLADKGMFKEAVAIWRNRAELCSVTLYDAFFYRLLIGAGQIAQAFECYADGQSELQKQGSLADVREQLAALSLANPDAFAATNLPAEDVLVGDFPTAKAALEAYCAGDDQAMQQQLKHISFRSPFRDLRQILKALLQASSDASGASVLLKKIAVGSAFYPLA